MKFLSCSKGRNNKILPNIQKTELSEWAKKVYLNKKPNDPIVGNSIIGSWDCNYIWIGLEPIDKETILIKENGVASIAEYTEYTGSWNTSGNSITIKLHAAYYGVSATVTMNGTINNDKAQVTGNCVFLETDEYNGPSTINGTFVMTKTQ